MRHKDHSPNDSLVQPAVGSVAPPEDESDVSTVGTESRARLSPTRTRHPIHASC
jgi:hypothetical protein